MCQLTDAVRVFTVCGVDKKPSTVNQNFRVSPALKAAFDSFTDGFRSRVPRVPIGDIGGAAMLLLMQQPDDVVLRLCTEARNFSGPQPRPVARKGR